MGLYSRGKTLQFTFCETYYFFTFLLFLLITLYFFFSSFCNNQQPQMVRITSQVATTCSKSAIQTPEQHWVKYAQIRAFSDLYFIWKESYTYFPVFHKQENKDHRKPAFQHISHCARCEICSKLTIKSPECVKLMIKLTIKTSLTLFWSLSC